MHSLEFYLLQFHVFMTRESSMVLYIIPKEKWGYTNMVIVGLICRLPSLEAPFTPSARLTVRFHTETKDFATFLIGNLTASPEIGEARFGVVEFSTNSEAEHSSFDLYQS